MPTELGMPSTREVALDFPRSWVEFVDPANDEANFVEGKFTFRGEPKPVEVPDAPPADMAGSGSGPGSPAPGAAAE